MIKIYAFATVLILLIGTSSFAQPVVITDVTVIDVIGGTERTGMSVVISDGRIADQRAGHINEIPPDATVVDGEGKYLIPGLWDMHVHTSSDSITREILYSLCVANGVTGVRNMHADCFEEGPNVCSALESSIMDATARKHDVAASMLVGPREVANSAFANGPEPDGVSTIQGPETVEDARAFVRMEQERGVDFIKVYDMLPREGYFAVVEEAHNLGIPVAGHVPIAVKASEASDAGQRSIEHCCAGISWRSARRGRRNSDLQFWPSWRACRTSADVIDG